MNKRNKVKHLNKAADHRNSMINNLVTSFFMHERIESTSAKIKVARSFAEKLITRAKKNLAPDAKPESKLHNRREIMKKITNPMVVDKLIDDIAGRFSERAGGYTRIYKLVNRQSDNSEMSILELVEKKEKAVLKEEAIAKRKPKKAAPAKDSKEKKEKKEKKSK
ncbi:50S ribosomal protein L17 [Leptospira sp. GIMC2001]|uniref:50S ribosomal protein L17 n=1 Tax=Leptospira sp. GIMC2001 TaxID=1513297 RepID=UPI002349DC19|nr:50S ribosomal protein L17 [Leptospira sp. GIMC2001]WCL51107.1 50S ribosomal protein L17 [Leptospira sp. GIMC2001]